MLKQAEQKLVEEAKESRRLSGFKQQLLEEEMRVKNEREKRELRYKLQLQQLGEDSDSIDDYRFNIKSRVGHTICYSSFEVNSLS